MMSWVAAIAVLSSCSSHTHKLNVKGVSYQSFRTEYAQPTEIPNDAKIAVSYLITAKGTVVAVVKNLTTEIMTIDQTRSFFVNTDGASTSYYDPSVKSTSQTQFSSGTNGASFGMGALADAFGIGGIAGSLLGGIGLNSSSTSGNALTSNTYFKDLPQVTLGPKSHGVMSKEFKITGVAESPSVYQGSVYQNCTYKTSPLKFSVHISYSFDNGKTYDLISTNFYSGSLIDIPVAKKQVNTAFREIYLKKPDALAEPAFMFNIGTNIDQAKETEQQPIYNTYVHGALIDYK